jgi:hypothetical protein
MAAEWLMRVRITDRGLVAVDLHVVERASGMRGMEKSKLLPPLMM